MFPVHDHSTFIDRISDHAADIRIGKKASISFLHTILPQDPGDTSAAKTSCTKLIHFSFHLCLFLYDRQAFIWQLPVAISIGSKHQGTSSLLPIPVGVIDLTA